MSTNTVDVAPDEILPSVSVAEKTTVLVPDGKLSVSDQLPFGVFAVLEEMSCDMLLPASAVPENVTLVVFNVEPVGEVMTGAEGATVSTNTVYDVAFDRFPEPSVA